VEWLPEDRGYKTRCHIWQRGKTYKGYGVRRINGRQVGAHVAAFERENGPVPHGHEVHHLCRQRDCVRASHLEAVTRAEHIELTVKVDAAAIRAATGSNVEIAREYGISAAYVGRIRRGVQRAAA